MAPNAGLCRAATSQLVVIDVQTRLAAAMPPDAIETVTRNIDILVQAAALLEVPVLATRQYPKGLGPIVPALQSRLEVAGTPIDKTQFSCCAADGFLECCDPVARPELVLTGLETHICVLQTALEARDKGFRVFVVEDAVCSRKSEHKRNGLARMAQQGVIVTNVESVVFEWLQDSGHRQFKAVSSLLR